MANIGGMGVSFVPGVEDPNARQGGLNGGAAPSGVSPLQAAVKLLSLKLPRFGGQGGMTPGGLAPNALLQGGGSAGAPGDLLAALRALMGLGGQAGAPGPVPNLPSPNFTFQPPEIPRTGPVADDNLVRPGQPSMPTFAPGGGSPGWSTPQPRPPRMFDY